MGAGGGMLVLSSLLGAYGSIQEGKQANKIAKYNVAVNEQEAVASEEKAVVDEGIHRERVKSAISTLRARIGKSGVTSPAQAQAIEASIEAGEMDALAIRHSGEIDAARARSGAKIERMRGKAAIKTSKIRAGTSLLTGGSQLISQNPDLFSNLFSKKT